MPMWHFIFFDLARHAPELAQLEADYTRSLTPSVFLLLCMTALSCFFSGRGKTVLVMIISMTAALANIVLNWWLIFNPPAWAPFITPGVVGAAWGTNLAHLLAFFLYLPSFLHPSHRAHFRTWGRSVLPDR